MAAGPPRLYKWYQQVARANTLITPITDEQYQSSAWADRYAQTQPAYIAHKNFGPCLIYAKRQKVSGLLGPSRLYYLVALVTPVEDKTLKESRQGYFEVPAVVSVEDQNEQVQVLTLVYPLRCIITQFVLVRPQEASIVQVYNGKVYTTMTLGELRQRTDVNNEEDYRVAFDAFMQSNPEFMRRHDISAASVMSPGADARLIMASMSSLSTLVDEEEEEPDARYALAPHFIRQVMQRKDARKGRAPIDARTAQPLVDPYGVVSKK